MSNEIENKDKVATGESKEAAADPQEQIVYKMSPELRATLYAYLNTRPMDEVEDFMTQMFEIPDKEPYYTAAGIQDLSKYLRSKCPRQDAKPLLEAMVKPDAITRYKMIPNKAAETETPTSDVPQDGADGKMEVVKN